MIQPPSDQDLILLLLSKLQAPAFVATIVTIIFGITGWVKAARDWRRRATRVGEFVQRRTPADVSMVLKFFVPAVLALAGSYGIAIFLPATMQFSSSGKDDSGVQHTAREIIDYALTNNRSTPFAEGTLWVAGLVIVVGLLAHTSDDDIWFMLLTPVAGIVFVAGLLCYLLGGLAVIGLDFPRVSGWAREVCRSRVECGFSGGWVGVLAAGRLRVTPGPRPGAGALLPGSIR